jgi:ceramide glucosyltransferase
MALRRETLEAIGGFAALARWLADDHELGARVRALGLRTVVSRYEVTTTVHEPGFRALFAHELRWLRTIRTSQPLGHAFLFITYVVPMTLLALPFAPRHPWALALPLLGLALRVAVHYLVQYPVLSDARVPPRTMYGDRRSAWLIPLRELLSLAVWMASFVGLRVTWRESVMQVRSNGVLLGDDGGAPA